MISRLHLLCAILLVTGSSLAQQVWIVDKLDRRGTDFTSLNAAYNAAAVGDVLYLRDTSPQPVGYTMPALTKGVTIISESSTRTVFGPQFGIVPISIPAGQRLELINVPTVGVNCSNCQGTLHFEDCLLGSTAGSSLVDCASIEVVRCIWDTTNYPIRFVRSNVLFIDSRAFVSFNPSGNVECINATDSELTFVNSNVEGANGIRDQFCFIQAPNTSAMVLQNSVAYAGTGTSLLAGLLPAAGLGCPTQSCSLQYSVTGTGDVYVDPRAQVNCLRDPAITWHDQVVTTMRTSKAEAGKDLSVQLRAEPGALVFALLDVPNPTTTPAGPAALDPFQATFVGCGVIPATGSPVSFLTPLDATTLLGFELVAQGVAFEPQGTTSITNPAPMVVQRPVRTPR